MNQRFELLIPVGIYEAMLANARDNLPNECCGLLAGTIADGLGQVGAHYPLINALASPTRYESESRGMFAAVKAMRAGQSDVVAVYHSHPSTDPIPSRHDLERNYSTGVVNIIIGLAGDVPDVRAWWLTEHDYDAADWRVV